MADRVTENLPKTNNHIEGYHRGVQNCVDGDHPSVFKFLKFMKKEENQQHQEGMQWLAGDEGRRNVDAERRAKRILQIVNSRQERTTIDFLRGITYNYNMG